MAHPNEDMLRTGYEAFSKGDLDTIDTLWSDDIVWRSYGNSPFSGEFHGKPEIFGMFARIPQETDAFEIEVHDVLANDDHAVVLVDQTMRRGDNVWEGPAVHVYHVNADRKVTEAWIQPVDETSMPDDFWD